MKKKLVGMLAILLIIVLSYPFWKPYAKHYKWFVIATNVAQDSLRRYGFVSRQIGQSANLTWPESKIPGEIQRIRSTYDQYLRYADWTTTAVKGTRIIELGPGYTIGIPLMFAADGADFVAGLDKFVRLQDGKDFGLLYSRMRDTLSDVQKTAFDRAIRLQPKVQLNKDHAAYIDHKELSDCIQQLGPATYDIIVSSAVMEEIYDPTPNFKAQDAILRPGGIMVHRIDLRDYGMFSKYGFHPLEYLTVPDWIYRRMVDGSGQPNRRLADYYRGLGQRLGYKTAVWVTKALSSDKDLPEPKRELRAGVDYGDQQKNLVNEIRPRLIDRYKTLSDADLLTASIVFVGQKPGGQK